MFTIDGGFTTFEQEYFELENAWQDEEDELTIALECKGYRIDAQNPGDPPGWRVTGPLDKVAADANQRLQLIQSKRESCWRDYWQWRNEVQR